MILSGRLLTAAFWTNFQRIDKGGRPPTAEAFGEGFIVPRVGEADTVGSQYMIVSEERHS